MLAAAGAFADLSKEGRVAERAVQDREAHVNALVDENSVEVLGIDLEVRHGEINRRAGHDSLASLNHGAPGATHAAVPSHRHVGPFDGDEHASDGVEGAITFEEQRRGGDHGDRLGEQRDGGSGL